jgi:hypothetical protein
MYGMLIHMPYRHSIVIRLNLELASEELMFHSMFIKYQFATFESLKFAILVPCITYCFYIFPLWKFCFQSTIHGESNSQNLFLYLFLAGEKNLHAIRLN